MTAVVTRMRAVLDPGQVPDLRERLARSRRPGAAADGWDIGVPDAWLEELVAAWEHFDVTAFQDRLDAWQHLLVDVDGQVVHAMHAPGQGRSRSRWC